MWTYVYLICAIVCEVVGTSALNANNGFTRLGFSLAAVGGYGASLYCLSLALRHMNLAVAYALWGALGIVLTGLAGHFFFRQRLDMPAILGIGLIVTGVCVISSFSKTVGH